MKLETKELLLIVISLRTAEDYLMPKEKEVCKQLELKILADMYKKPYTKSKPNLTEKEI